MAGQEREFTMRFLAGATDRNVYGNVHGGSMMKWMDEAAYACAAGWSGMPCVTISVSGITFHKPLAVGHIVELDARLVLTTRSTMHVAVNVFSRDPRHGEYEQTTSCLMVFVALDADGRPTEVPRWEPVTPQDQELQEHARRLMELGQGIQGELRHFQEQPGPADEA